MQGDAVGTTRSSALGFAFWKRRVDRLLVVTVLVGGSGLWWFASESVSFIGLTVTIVVMAGLGLVRAWLVRQIRERRTPDDEDWVLRV